MRPDVRERLVLPLLIPLGLVGVIALVAVGFGLILLFNTITVSLVLATVVSAAILAAFGLASSQREEELTRAKRSVITLAGIAPLAVGALVAVDALPVEGEKVADRECEYCVPEDAVVLVAENIAFDQDRIVLPAGQEDSILLRNQDQNVQHDVAIYPVQGDEPLLGEPIFDGEDFAGVAQRVYTFEAPEAGTYYYNCTIHPQMNGDAIFE